ncbi:chromosome partitioning protein ParB [Prauserella marina]|uniref:Chromosome partitioning protein, ParB family n=1 Tax=Prauserella marina TaxID=530584 RepID=A0A222VXZ0_9PSEU|nr:ParB/RepB/Spo0J family partition protein [Prauserella marina]ASR38809.1 chromosome partitioning protein ParB [Prauserella marina]PWV82171.1 ParB family chromosome partitioning protein [Prauserella marina]SDD20811.1 chromosome partitioning protein, ParB family [Prauserella marina]
MSERRGGLGRGLAALIPTGPVSSEEVVTAEVKIDQTAVPAPPPGDWFAANGAIKGHGGEVAGAVYREVPISSIKANPKQPRQVFDEEALAELEHSIREFGLMQPIVVRQLPGDEYELVMGERRLRASQQAELELIPAIVRQTADEAMLRDALLENIHRVQLNPLEEAAAYQQLLDEFDVTHEELASRIGRSRPVITNTIRLLRLPLPVQRRVAAGVLSAGHARALLSLDEPEAQEELAARIVAEGLSVRATEEAVTLAKGAAKPKQKAPARKPMQAPGLQDLAERLSDSFDTRVKVDLGRRKGRIVVEFGSVDDLERIVGLMDPNKTNQAQITDDQ